MELLCLSNGRPGVRTAIQIEVHSPGKDELPRVPDQSPKISGSLPILDFVVSDESLDRYDEIISASGWRLDTYRRNPVFQNAHQYGDILFTLGKALITEVRGFDAALSGTPHSALRNPHLFQRVQFATDVNPIARIAYGLYQGKFLNAVSVGFIPIRWEDGETSLASSPGGPALCRRRYFEQELLEVSAVGIPANPNALALGLKSGAIEKADLRETLALLKSILSRRMRPPGGIKTPNPNSLIFLARELHSILRRA
jgi:hypothetical protein